MFRMILTLALAVLAAPVAAHPGHLAGLAGHDHWVAGAAIGLAIGLGLWGALKGNKGQSDQDADPRDDEIEPEAEAA